MHELVDSAIDIIVNERAPLREIGTMLDESWRLKREIASCVSTPQIDEIYDAGRSAGAIGGKLLGAGGGGFLVFFVEPGDRERVRERLKNLIHVSVDVDREGSKIVLFQPEGL
jgi:D-glycero-alpha-D-manno-heptose-7-phosphate kinase